MTWMTPEEQQGVLVTIGVQANTIHALQDFVETLQAELRRLKEKYESDAANRDPSEVVHSGDGTPDYNGSSPSPRVVFDGGGS